MRPFRSPSPRLRSFTRSDLQVQGAQRVFRGVYVSAAVDIDLVVRARAALLVHPTGVIGGIAAGAVWGSVFTTPDPEVDVYVTTTGARSQDGLRALRGELSGDEVSVVDEVRVTAPVRTALDLARGLPLIEAVAAVEALCRAAPLRLDEVRAAARDRPLRGVRAVSRVLDLADTRSSSPTWSRARMILVMRGVAVPEVAYELHDATETPVGCLELAWPDVGFGLRAARKGPATPAPRGWRVEPLDPGTAVQMPDRFAAGVVRTLRTAGRLRPQKGQPSAGQPMAESTATATKRPVR